MIKDVLAVVDASEPARNGRFVDHAIAFAELHGAHLTFAVAAPIPTPDYMLISQPPFVWIDDFVSRAEEAAARLRAKLSDAPVEVRVITADPDVLVTKVAVHARYADVVLFGCEDAYENGRLRRRVIEEVLFASGRPAIICPDKLPPQKIDHVCLGWNATRESARAIHDLLPFAEPASTIRIIVVDGDASERGHGSQPGADIAVHLARHGHEVSVDEQPAGGREVSEQLVSCALRRGAKMLVVGAYAHSRFREMILGGVTRDLLKGAPVPVFIAH